ncbi:hypothetical protein ABKN59_004779 [Abortiporus biennis]
MISADNLDDTLAKKNQIYHQNLGRRWPQSRYVMNKGESTENPFSPSYGLTIKKNLGFIFKYYSGITADLY